MSEYQSNLPAGEIRFHQWCEPPLEPGNYTMLTEQTVQALAEENASRPNFTKEFNFSVAGPRFSLDPSEIYSVYPPKGHIGDFSNSLPHIVFTRRTLPWERSLWPGHRQEGDKLPWLTLLVFSADDFGGKFPEIMSRPVGELINPVDALFVGPKLDRDVKGKALEQDGLAAYEKKEDLCNTIEVPWKLFQSVAPSADDLAYLAHVREVNTGHKETLSFLADGWFSVVLANRFPQPEQPLSLANLGDVASLVTKLRSGADAVSGFLWKAFSPPAQDLLKEETADPQKEKEKRTALINELNRIIGGESIYVDNRFEGVTLSGETVKLRDKTPQGSEIARFNRMLLENTYPGEIVKSPPLAVENRAILVSLEGLTDYLPGQESVVNKPVRLAVLASWSFHCREAFAFKASMNKLEVQRLCVPWEADRLARGKLSPAEEQVRVAREMGYTALNHSTRRGEKAVSWYRGPLIPLYLRKVDKYTFRPAADAALRYSPLDGMMDVSYAAAFQLGRLLALQDRHFATALYAYRNGVRRQINEVLGRKRLGSVFAGAEGTDESQIMSAYLRTLSSDSNGSTARSGWVAEESGFPDGAGGDSTPLRKAALAKLDELRLSTDFDLTIPKPVCRWLARLVLLYRVPFTYLVADERMLPPESMRFFYLDPNWLKCLLEGACSVGRSSSRDELVDKYLRDKFLDFAMEQALEVRTKPTPITSNSAAYPSVVTTAVPHGLSTNDKILISGVSSSNADINDEHTVTVIDSMTFSVPVDASEHAGTGGSFVRSTTADIEVKQAPARLPAWPLTGFLLRSPVVEGWQGLEMRAWKDSGSDATEALAPLRIDRLAPDIMLCIFNGKVNRIEVKQPPEGMHFGASVDGNGFKRFHLRSLIKTEKPLVKANGGLKGAQPGDQIEKSETPGPLRTNSSHPRVIEVAKLATNLETILKSEEKLAMTHDATFTSADFGVEMVESPGRVLFDVTNKESAQ